jgi:hypothetical protein
MKILLLLFTLFLFIPFRAQVVFTDHFTGERLRYDYILTGNSQSTSIYDYRFVREPYWGGSTRNLIDTFHYGELLVEVYDSATNIILYSKGYSSLFKEWQLTKEAKLKELAFIESLVIPYPKYTIKIVLYERDSLLEFQLIHFSFFNPMQTGIPVCNHQERISVTNLLTSGDPNSNIDIAIISEGYTALEQQKFYDDTKRSIETFFSWLPYRNHHDSFNFYAVFTPSEESGSDIPGDSLWRNTVLNSSFYTFGSERYLTVSDIVHMREIVSDIPYDQICVMVNTEKYGGGGVYNSFTVFSAKNEFSGFLLMHEFGHAFAGLADEYYTSPTAYEDSIETSIEPYEPNITTRVNFQSKWADMISDTIPVPTPNCEKYRGTVGLFEGAMYRAKGIYRPAFDCAMKSKTCAEFCPVCQRAIERMILFNCGQ